MNKISSFDVYKNVKTLINSSGDNVNYFCDLLKHLSKDKSKIFVLNSSDSILDGIKLSENPVSTDKNNLINIATSLLRVYRSAYFPKSNRGDLKSCTLPTLLEDSLNQIKETNFNFEDSNTIVNELKKTSQLISENTLHDNYGPLRPFVIDHLKHYQSELLKSKELDYLKWLEYSLSLLDVMKVHSIDSKKLANKIINTVQSNPELIEKLTVENLYHLSNMDLSSNIRKNLDNYIQSILNKDVNTLVKHLKIVFDKYDKTTIENYMYALLHKSRFEKNQGMDLMEIVRNLRNLNERHNDKDLTNLTNRLLEYLYPKITQTYLGFKNQQFNYSSGNFVEDNGNSSNTSGNSSSTTSTNTNGNFSVGNNNRDSNNSNNNNNSFSSNNSTSNINRDHIAFIFETYVTLLKRPTSPNYIHNLSSYILENKDSFTPIHLVSMIDTVNRSVNVNSYDSSKIQMNNEYSGMSEVSNELTKYLLNELEKLEFNDLCGVLYSFSLYQNFQFYDVLSNYPVSPNKVVVSRREEDFKEKLMEIVRRRILFNLENNDNKSNMLYSKYLVKTMINKDFDLNNYIKFNTKDIINRMSTSQLVNILNTTNCTNYNHEVLDEVLENVTERLESVKLDDIQSLIEKNKLMKNADLNNKLFSILTYKSINNKNGYSNLLRSLSNLHYESDPSIVDTVLHYLSRYMFHLSVYDVESLLSSTKKLKIFNNKILDLLNHTCELNIKNTPNKVLTDLLCHLKDMRVRHEPLIRKLTDKLLNNFKNSNEYYIPDLISLTDSLSELSIPYNDLYVYLANYLSKNVKYYKEEMAKKMTTDQLVNKDTTNTTSTNNTNNTLDTTNTMNKDNMDKNKENENKKEENKKEKVEETVSKYRRIGVSRDGREGLRNPNRFSDLNLRDKIELLYSISNLGVVDQNLKTLYVSVIDQLYPENREVDEENREENKEKKDKENKEINKTNKDTNNQLEKVEENDLLLKLYEVHIEFILNNIYNQEGDAMSKRLERASKVWFTGQELKSQKFKKSDTYVTIKNTLKSLDVKFESGVTEIYFCNFVVREGGKNTAICVVPEEDLLRFWTTSLDSSSMIQNPDLSVGNSQKVIKNLKLLGYNVVELLQPRWDSNPSERVSFLKNQLNLN